MKMFWKEFRECSRTLPLAIVVFALVWWYQLPARNVYGTGFDSSSASTAALLGCVYSLLLGALQVWPLQRTDVRGWLLSQPVSRRRMFWTMTLAAFAVYVLAMALPFFITLWVLKSYLPEMAPIDPRAFYVTAVVYAFAFVMHPGAIWMLSRPGRWVGSKACVLAAPVGAFMLCMSAITAPTGWLIAAGVLAIAIVGMFCIILISCDSFVSASNSPSRWGDSSLSTKGSRRLAFAGVFSAILIMACTGAGIATVFLSNSLRSDPAPGQPTDSLRFKLDGTVLRARVISKYNPRVGSSEVVVGAFELPQTSDLNEIISLYRPSEDEGRGTDPKEFRKLLKGKTSTRFGGLAVYRLFQWTNDYNEFTTNDGMAWYRHADGYLMGYMHDYNNSKSPLLRTVCDRSGFDSVDSPFARGPISTISVHANRGISLGQNEYLGNQQGIYQFNPADRAFETLLDQRIDSAALYETFGGNGWTLLIRDHLTLQMFDVLPKRDGVELPQSPVDTPDGFVPNVPWPETKLALRQTVKLPPDWFDFGGLSFNWTNEQFVDLGSQGFQYSEHRNGHATKTVRINESGLVGKPTIYVWPKPKAPSLGETVSLMFLPPTILIGILSFGTFGIVTAPAVTSISVQSLWVLLGLIVIHGLLAWFLTRKACKTRHLSVRVSRRWGRASWLLGIATPVMVLCLHERIVVDECQACGSTVRVDDPECSSCGKPHAETPARGIEILAA